MIRVVLADDAAELRRLLRALLEKTGEFSVVGEADNGDLAVEVCAEKRPDAVLLDLSMPIRSGLDALGELVQITRVVVLSGFASQDVVSQCLERGASSYVEKGKPVADIAEALRKCVTDNV